MRMLFLVACLALSACSTKQLPNGCVVDAKSHDYAVASRNQLSGKTAFNSILAVEFTDTKPGHALSIFEHRTNLWAYDYARGSWQISQGISTAELVVARMIYPRWRIKNATWL
jgi:hypothetical protein